MWDQCAWTKGEVTKEVKKRTMKNIIECRRMKWKQRNESLIRKTGNIG